DVRPGGPESVAIQGHQGRGVRGGPGGGRVRFAEVDGIVHGVPSSRLPPTPTRHARLEATDTVRPARLLECWTPSAVPRLDPEARGKAEIVERVVATRARHGVPTARR